MLRIYCTSVEKQIAALNAEPEFLSVLPAERLLEIERMRQPMDRSRALAGEFLSRRMLAVHSNLQMEQIQIERKPLKKPSLPGGKLFFNLAHSGDRIALGVSSAEVGVDVEEIRPLPDLESVARNFFSSSEQQQLLARFGKARLECFFETWTLKESFLKAIGQGLSRELNSFSVTPDGLGRAELELSLEGRWHLRVYRNDPGYRLALCSELPQLPEAVEWI